MLPLLLTTLLLTTTATSYMHITPARPFTGNCDLNAGFGPPGGVYMCFDANFKGTCWDWMPNAGECYSFHKDTTQKPKSIGPNPGGHCVFYREKECKGTTMLTAAGKKMRCPGITNAEDPGWYGSMKCFPTRS
ncbi:hypothetical protein NX059_001430 [Plenodomus lindquistii]|nr:hypothetical protein NX059_001430 [Plenodomus lindquistii]